MNSMILVLAFVFLVNPLALSAERSDVAPGTPLTDSAAAADISRSVSSFPIGPIGRRGRYRIEGETGLRPSLVRSFVLTLGPRDSGSRNELHWTLLEATKVDGTQFRVWLLGAGYPPETLKVAQRTTARYLLQEGASEPREFRHQMTGQAILPSVGGWKHLWPRADGKDETTRRGRNFPEQVRYLGHRYRLDAAEDRAVVALPENPRRIDLRPDLLIGVPSNTRQKDDTRRYDNSDYEMVRLAREDYREMAEAGLNCLRVDARQLPWMDDLPVFYWGIGGNEIPYPECLYRSAYLGPVLFLDEPAVGTRDYVIRPRLEKDAAFRKALTPQMAFEAFREHFQHALEEGAPTSFLKGLKARADVDLGEMTFAQENLFTWETIESTAAHQLSQDPRVPAAMVWEPPGRVGTYRTLPELNMTYGCQLPVDDPKNLIDIICGFLRGAARLTGKHWGMSVYGAVDRADAFWYLTHAYDLGATHFFFWDNYRLACVPYRECLALARNLRAHAGNFRDRDLDRLRRAAEVVILLPPGYNLGHVQLGKGNLWGVGELNLERTNRAGVTYRTVMSQFFLEIERCLRFGIAFDLLWDLPGIRPSGYRELIRVREDGKVEIEQDGKCVVLDQARMPPRPPGASPGLEVTLSANKGQAPLEIAARAVVTENAAPVFYTLGTDPQGVYQNAMVAWEIYGPDEEDHRILQSPGTKPQVVKKGRSCEVSVRFTLPRPGRYRLRAATVDLAGRTAVVWQHVDVER